MPASVDSLHLVFANIEHPPLVKWVTAGFIGVLGDNWLAWRLPIVLFALLATVMTYLIAKRFMSERLATFSAGLLSLSVIFLLLGSTAMLDMPCLALGLVGVYFALRGNYGTSGVMFGLSFLCKELAVLMFLVTWVYIAFKKVKWFRQLFFVGLAFMVALSGIWIYDVVYQPVVADAVITNPVEHFWLMVVWQLNLNHIRAPNATHWYPPISWVTPFGNNALHPLSWVWFQSGNRMVYDWVAQPNPMVEYLMFPLLFILPLLYWKRREGLALLSWLWIAASYLPWFVTGFFVRTEANFYVIYSVPFLAIGSAYLYTFIKNRKLKYGLAITQLLVGLVFFLYFFPLPIFR